MLLSRCSPQATRNKINSNKVIIFQFYSSENFFEFSSRIDSIKEDRVKSSKINKLPIQKMSLPLMPQKSLASMKKDLISIGVRA